MRDAEGMHMIAEYFCKGLLTGMGSSAADLIYSCVGVFGILCKKEPVTVQKESKGTLAFCFLSAFTTALVNPATILSFMVAFAAFGIHGGLSAKQGAALIVGILAGTLCWWPVLSGVTAHFRDRIAGKIYRWLNCVLGFLMTGFGIDMVIRGIMK